MRRLLSALVLVGLVPSAVGANPKPKPPALGTPRILYSSDWSGTSEIYAVDPSGRLPIGQLTFGRPPSCGGPVFLVACGFVDPVPSPDGRWLLYQDVTQDGRGGELWIAAADGSAPRLLAKSASSPAWSPDSRLIAFNDTVVNVTGRRVAGIGTREGQARRPAAVGSARLNFCAEGGPVWSPEGRSLAYPVCSNAPPGRRGRFRVVSVVGYQLAWSPDGRRIAYVDHGNLGLASPSGIPLRTIGKGDEPAWSPDGRASRSGATTGCASSRCAPAKRGCWPPTRRRPRPASGQPIFRSVSCGPLTAGRSPISLATSCHAAACDLERRRARRRSFRPVPHRRLGDTKYGGRMISLAWTKPTAALRYRRPLPAPTRGWRQMGSSPTGPSSISPPMATGSPTRPPATPSPPGRRSKPRQRSSPAPARPATTYTPLMALTRTSHSPATASPGSSCAATTRRAGISTSRPSPPRRSNSAAAASPATCSDRHRAEATSTRRPAPGRCWCSAPGSRRGTRPPITTEKIWQSILRAPPAGCPCPTLRTDPVPLIIDDVDAGHIAAHGNNGIVVLDDSGTQLSFIPVNPPRPRSPAETSLCSSRASCATTTGRTARSSTGGHPGRCRRT